MELHKAGKGHGSTHVLRWERTGCGQALPSGRVVGMWLRRGPQQVRRASPCQCQALGTEPKQPHAITWCWRPGRRGRAAARPAAEIFGASATRLQAPPPPRSLLQLAPASGAGRGSVIAGGAQLQCLAGAVVASGAREQLPPSSATEQEVASWPCQTVSPTPHARQAARPTSMSVARCSRLSTVAGSSCTAPFLASRLSEACGGDEHSRKARVDMHSRLNSPRPSTC